MSPLVTVVVPLYNGARYIEQTLESVQRQSMADLEVVVVDDGSTDGGPALAADHPVRPSVLTQPNHGVAVARNRGLARARGRWVTFLDQDDLWHPDRLQRLLAFVEAEPQARLVATTEIAFDVDEQRAGLSAVDPNVGAWASLHAPTERTLDALLPAADVAGSARVWRHDSTDLLAGPVTVTTSFLADPDVLRLAGGFAPHAAAMDDYWLLVNAARLTPVHRVDQPTIFYRVHLDATSRRTALALPFLSSGVALRLGGVLEPDAAPGPLHAHLLAELLASPDYQRSATTRAQARHLAALLWPRGEQRRRVGVAELDRLSPRAMALLRQVRSRW